MKFWSLYVGVLLLGICHCTKIMEEESEEYNFNDEAEAQDVETQQTQINIMPPGINSKRKGRGSRINLEFIAGGSELSTGGVTYIRWGKMSCPTNEGTELMYKGRAAGSGHNQKGGGTDLLCLPENPEFLASRNGGHRAYVYQTEYETNTGPSFQNLHDHDIPCATCFSSQRGAKIMIPGKTTCLKGWTREYYGYLMSAFHSHYRMTYSCVDVTAEAVPGTAKNRNGALLYHVEVQTGALPSAYINGNELTCVVCTK